MSGRPTRRWRLEREGSRPDPIPARGLFAFLALWLGLGVALASAAAPSSEDELDAAAAGDPLAASAAAATAIENRAELSWIDGSGTPRTIVSSPAVVMLAQAAGVDIYPNRRVEAESGAEVLLRHTISNLGAASDCFLPEAFPEDVFETEVREYSGGSPGPKITACIPLDPGESFEIVVVVQVDSLATAGETSSVVVRATSESDPGIWAQALDRITITGPPISLILEKLASPDVATFGDVIDYSIQYEASGSGVAEGVVISDPIPAGVSYIAGSMSVDGQAVTDADDGDAGRFDQSSNTVLFELGDVPADVTGTVGFQVHVESTDPDGAVSNIASVDYGGSGAAESESSNSATTPLISAEVMVEKRLDGSEVAHIDEEVRFTILYGNASSRAAARDAVVLDSLPAGLEYVSSEPPAEVDGQEVRWEVGDLAPGDTAQIQLVARVTAEVTDSVVAVNRARFAPFNGPAAESTAQVALVGLRGDELEIDKSADALQAGVGETVGYAIELRNRGSAPISNIVVGDTLPPEMLFVEGSASGADSVRSSGRVVTFFSAARLDPGSSRTIRYAAAIVSGGSDVLANVAVASAEAGFVRAPAVTAFVRLQEAWPLETRVALGRVWVDLNGNGTLDAGEPGVEGVDVWTEDASVATTDADGKFSLRNVRRSEHAFHLDTRSLPAVYRLADPSGDLLTRVSDGWTSPRLDFRLLPRGARLAEVWLPGEELAADPPQAGGRVASLDISMLARAAMSGSNSTDRRADVTDGPDRSSGAIRIDSLPDAREWTSKRPVEIVLEPAEAGWPEVAFQLPPGWYPVEGSARLGSGSAPDPDLQRDRSGEDVLYWEFDRAGSPEPVHLLLSANSPVSSDVPTVPALRTAEERAAGVKRTFPYGYGVAIMEPADGTVLRMDRVYIGVQGEPQSPVALFDGDSLVAEAEIRGDGIHDFIAVKLAPGPHRLRVRLRNSNRYERWDSVAVHVTAEPARFEVEAEPLHLVADGNTLVDARVRVLDRWGVPVLGEPLVTVWTEGALPMGMDVESNSAGVQHRADPAGWVHVRLRPGKEAGEGVLGLRAGSAETQVALAIMPEIRDFIVTGFGRFGFGASPEPFAAITVRGRLDERTSLTLSYDTRDLDDGNGFFGRGYDPLEEARYPIIGDASSRRVTGASDGAFSARLERDLNWFAVGSLVTDEFSEGLRLNRYRRALTGAAARVATGPVTIQAFGSLTRQSLQQLQIRGDGTSGPYTLDANIRRGTERVVIEARDQNDAALTLSQEQLSRFVDYEIDYELGALLLKRPIPAADIYGNPVFVMVTYEAMSGGDKDLVAGLRASVDVLGDARANRLALSEGQITPAVTSSRSSLRVGVVGVRGGGEERRHYMAGADVSARVGDLVVGGEVSYSTVPDSSDVAVSIEGALTLFRGAVDLQASWMRVGPRYVNPAEISLRSGTEDLRLSAGWRFARDSEVRLTHQRQDFKIEGVSRRQTAVRLNQFLGSKVRIGADITSDQFRNVRGVDESLGGTMDVTYAVTPRLSLFGEGRLQVHHTGQNVLPDHVGVGAQYQILDGVKVEVRHRRVFVDADTSYSITNFGVRSDVGFGTEVWSSYQLVGGADGVHNAAVIGLNNRVRLGQSWTINSLLERRVGVGQAPIENPVRALPFVQQEEDYLAASLGAEFLPPDAPYRLALRGEFRDGDFRSTRLFTVAGDVALSRSFALLSRQQLVETEEKASSLSGVSSRRSSLWGVAFRPVDSDAVNVLAKFEWLNEKNPRFGGVFSRDGEETRMIGLAELIWAPQPGFEFGARYATRFTDSELPVDEEEVQALQSRADYLGGRMRFDLFSRVAVGLGGRLLLEHSTSEARWDAAPFLVVYPIDALQIEMGYRFGDLLDPDFSVSGGHGFFITIGARVTRRTVESIGDFWRERF